MQNIFSFILKIYCIEWCAAQQYPLLKTKKANPYFLD